MSDHDAIVPSNGATHHPASELQNLMLATDVVESFLQEITSFAVTALGGEISASVTISRQGRPATVASSDAYAAQFDEVQYSQSEGPCLTAMRTGKTVLMDDLAADDRFERYRPRALALGVRSSLSLPLDGGDHIVGSLNLYAQHSHGFGAAELAQAALFADDLSRALGLAIRLAYQVEMTEKLLAALRSRTLLDQSLGIIMSQRLCDADAAMAILSADSLNLDVALLVRSAQILRAVRTPPHSDGRQNQN
ncbi:GAF and ANTAR domain-containing protein [Pengzhenrongella frigida]|uniref:ANTAR domain-containing protein n=1 Tax=Pengzhenrongella frigida TaxID=1259133 RepID=A0A4Q5MV92_9MICO|nr:GAF and ANTAR domain-containing protein [Cellulomonas sp. HLT2-17]RYV49430.1 ANTAR domain-containing protein [Cellulomonas sp. HLT2-17]